MDTSNNSGLKLNQSEQKMVDNLPEAVRQQVIDSLLAAKREARSFRTKVTDKGALSVYTGLSRFPVTLYKGQWEVLFANQDAIKALVATLPDRKAN